MNEGTPGFATFTSWYTPHGQGSGPGSHPTYTEQYRGVLETFLRWMPIRRVVDYGCGDWQFSRLVDWAAAEYIGLDVVPSLVERLNRDYSSAGRRFICVDADAPEVPSCDLLIVKDVAQHLANQDILRLERLFSSRARWIWWINDLHDSPEQNNHDIPRGDYRKLDLRLPPFSFPVSLVFRFGHQPDNKVLFQQICAPLTDEASRSTGAGGPAASPGT